MHKLTAIIIKGNPKFIVGNKRAEEFYQEIKNFLETLSYQVSFDDGAPYTSPKKADLWIGHSRGIDRLRFAPKGTRVLVFGASDTQAINHPDDNSTQITYPSNIVPNKFHYEFTDAMQQAIVDITKKIH